MTRLTVLGSCGAWPERGRACAGFLLSHNGFNLVIDLGYDTASRLLAHTAARDVGAVVITHEHPRPHGGPERPRPRVALHGAGTACPN
jgi:ribonuclease BN (tRNA processing enzyme)